jgi:hypothetical protein
MRDEWSAHPRDDCYFCGDESDVLESHHLVPRRYNGSDKDRNLVTVCPTCHQKLERLYDKRFYQSLGMSETDEVISYILEYLISELDHLQMNLYYEMDAIQDRIKALHSDEIEQDKLEEYISDAITSYHEDQHIPDTSETGGENDKNGLNVKKTIEKMEQDYVEGVPLDDLLEVLESHDVEDPEGEINSLKVKGKLYEPSHGHLRTT